MSTSTRDLVIDVYEAALLRHAQRHLSLVRQARAALTPPPDLASAGPVAYWWAALARLERSHRQMLRARSGIGRSTWKVCACTGRWNAWRPVRGATGDHDPRRISVVSPDEAALAALRKQPPHVTVGEALTSGPYMLLVPLQPGWDLLRWESVSPELLLQADLPYGTPVYPPAYSAPADGAAQPGLSKRPSAQDPGSRPEEEDAPAGPVYRHPQPEELREDRATVLAYGRDIEQVASLLRGKPLGARRGREAGGAAPVAGDGAPGRTAGRGPGGGGGRRSGEPREQQPRSS